MHKSLLKLLLAAAALLLSAAVHALGMGGINVTTALGQPLQADIELVAVSRTDRADLAARLASADDYKVAGLQFPFGNKFKFKLEARPNGDPYLMVSSDQPINDPFVTLLVELTWPSGKMLREYTFLLDPPGYAPDQPGLADLRVVAPAAEVVTTGALIAPVDAEIPSEIVEPALPVEPVTTPTEPAVAEGEAALPAEAIPAADEPQAGDVAEQKIVPKTVEIPPQAVEPLPAVPEWVTVPRGSTLYELADQHKSSDMSVERMLVAMYRANANEFGGRNMNRIKAGKILRLPDERELEKVTQSDAEREIRVQTADWNTYRQKLASAAAVSTTTQVTKQVAQQVAVGKISSSVIDHAPIAKETAKEVLKLSKGETPGDQAVAGSGGKGLADQDKKNAAQEEAIAKAKTLGEERMRTAMLEQNLKDAQLLAQLKAEKAELEAKLLAQQAAKSETKPDATPAVVADSKVKVESAAAKPPVIKPAAVTPPPEVATEPTLVEQILEEPLYLAAGAGLLLVMGGLGFVALRRKKKPSFGEEAGLTEDFGEITGHLAQPVIPSPDTGDFTQTVVTSAVHIAASGQPTHEPEAVDPISEADLFLSFGRDGQAEEILREALKTMPSNHQIHLKLLGIYSSRQDTDSFSAIARQLKDSGDEYAWEQAVEMGRKLEPNNPMYGGSGSMEDTTSATVQMPAFNIGGASFAESAAPAKPAALDMDFDLNLSPKSSESPQEQNFLADMETTTVLSSSHAEAEKSASMDFDITSTQSPSEGGGAQDASGPEGMVFDITGSYSAPAAQPEASAPGIDLGMAFTMDDFPAEKPAVKPAPAPLAADLSGISLNFDDEPVSSSPADILSVGGGEDQFQEVATKLDLAKAYQEMGDSSGAREILDEVLREGNAEQRQAAQDLLDQLY